KQEQKKRFLERLDHADKNWKFSIGDLHEREHWDEYQEAYEAAIRHTASREAPWHVVPADNKWFTRIVVAATIIETLDSLQLGYPQISKDQTKELRAARKKLMDEGLNPGSGRSVPQRG